MGKMDSPLALEISLDEREKGSTTHESRLMYNSLSKCLPSLLHTQKACSLPAIWSTLGRSPFVVHGSTRLFRRVFKLSLESRVLWGEGKLQVLIRCLA